MQSVPYISEKHIFLSYRSIEAPFALRLAADLKNSGVQLWMDRFDIRPGQEWRAEIERALTPQKCAAIIAILSPEYVRAPYCRRELSRADRLRLPIFPILLSPVPDTEWPLEIEGVQYVNFTDWQHEAVYLSQVGRLLEVLQRKAAAQVGVRPDRETQYLNSLISDLENYMGVLEYVELSAKAHALQAEASRPVPRKAMAAGLSILDTQLAATLSSATGADSQPARQPSRWTDIRDVWQVLPRFVLVGAPGAGKTTAIRRLALDAAHARLESPRTSPLPLFLRLPSWDEDSTPEDFVRRKWHEAELPDTDPIPLLAAGEVQLFLDGLNEMGASGPAKATALGEWLKQTEKSPKAIVVTCRISDYVQELELPLPSVQVEDLTEGQIRRFLSNYLGATAKTLLGQLQEQDILDQENSRSLIPLARNPYLLTALILVFTSNGDLPRNAGSLFRALTRALWTREDEVNTPGWVPFDEIEQRLGHLAFTMIDESLPVDVPRTLALHHIGSEALLNAASSANLIRQQSNMVSFYHQLIQEYFAAVELERRGGAGIRFTEPEFGLYGTRMPNKWDEVIVAWLGITQEDADSFVRGIAHYDEVLAAKCIASGIAISDETREEVFPIILDINGPYYAVGDASKLLARAGEHKIIPYLLKRLEHGNFMRVGGGAAESLVLIGAPAVPALIEALAHPWGQVSVTCAELLGKIGDVRAVPHLIPLLSDRSRSGFAGAYLMCDVVASALMKIETKQAISAVQDWHTTVIRELMRLGSGVSYRLLRSIEASLDDARQRDGILSNLSVPVVDAIAQIARQSHSHLTDSWESNYRIDTAIRILGQLGDPFSISVLEDILCNDDRISAAEQALERIGSVEALAALERARNCPKG